LQLPLIESEQKRVRLECLVRDKRSLRPSRRSSPPRSGAFSLTQQAIRLGFLPRMNIIHTAGHEMGQIRIPFVNWSLAIASIAAVIGFGSSPRACWSLRHSGFAADGDHDTVGDIRRAGLEA
jgi:K+ potassium transporter integral membrane domain